MPELVVVVQVLIAECQPEHPLADQRCDLVLDVSGRAIILEAGGETLGEADGLIGGPEQQRTGIRRDQAAIERGHHRTPFDACKTEQVRVTL